jgi:hypothetical protein
VCRDRRKRKVSTNRLMQVLPVASIPSDLRMAVLSLAEAPDQHEHRVRIAQRAEPFDVWGWPTSLERRAQGSRKEIRGDGTTSHLLPVVAVAACVALVIGAIFLLTGGGGSDGSKNADNKVPGGIAAGPSDSPSDAFPSPSDSVEPSPTTTTPSPSPTPTKHTPTPTPTTHRPVPPPPPSHKPPPPKPPKPGTLSVSGCSIDLGETSCNFTIKAVGGAVQWQVKSTSGVSASGGGTLKSGQSTTVKATKPSPCDNSGTGTVSFSPNGTASIPFTCGILEH